MRRHPQIAERIVLAAPTLADSAALIRSSHERTNGQGYPDGLVGQNIPTGSRIIAVYDAYHAMTSDRVYRPGIGSDAALDELKRHAGTQLDATVVDPFCKLKPRQHSHRAPHPAPSAQSGKPKVLAGAPRIRRMTHRLAVGVRARPPTDGAP